MQEKFFLTEQFLTVILHFKHDRVNRNMQRFRCLMVHFQGAAGADGVHSRGRGVGGQALDAAAAAEGPGI